MIRDWRSPLPSLWALAALLPFLLVTLWPALVAAQKELIIDCYYFNGDTTSNNTKCPNSNVCCGATATCLSNRLCHNPGDDENTFIRGPCAIDPSIAGWDEGCAQICQYDEAFRRFPRVTPCADGSLCCDNDSGCCQKGLGIFLDESGNVVETRPTAPVTSYPPKSDSPERITVVPDPSTSTTSTATSTSTSTSSTSDEATVTDPSTSDSTSSSLPASATTGIPPAAAGGGDDPSGGGGDNSIALKVGLGLGIPLVALLSACAVYFFVRWRRAAAAAVAAGHAGAGAAPPYYGDQAGVPDGYYSGTMAYSGSVGGGGGGALMFPKQAPVELGDHDRMELESRQTRYELWGGR